MRIFIWICAAVLLAGALVSGAITCYNLHDLSRTYAAASPELRRFMLYGPSLPLIDKVQREVPPHAGIVLIADVDPALFAYGLFPRRLWQPEVDPEMRFFLTGLPASQYPRRPPETFPAEWLLYVTPGNLAAGGDLRRLR